MKRKYLKIVLLLGLLLAILMFYNCEGFEDETFEMSVIDAAATAALAPRDSVAISIGTATFTRLDGQQFIIAHFANGTKDTVASVGIDSILTLNDYVQTLTGANAYISPNDTCYDVRTLADSANTYLLFNSGGAGLVTFYFTDYVRMNLLDVDGSSINAVQLADDMISLELLAGFYSTTGNSPKPIIKSRYAYELEDQDYLLQLITFEQTRSSRFFTAIIFE